MANVNWIKRGEFIWGEGDPDDVMNRPLRDVFQLSGYSRDGSDFSGFAKTGAGALAMLAISSSAQRSEFAAGTILYHLGERSFQRLSGSTWVNLTDAPTDVFNVKTYGAVGDGVVDDTVAINRTIQAAIKFGYRIPLTQSLSISGTVIQLTGSAASGMSSMRVPSYLRLSDSPAMNAWESVLVTSSSISENKLTVQRGMNGTVSQSWASGSFIEWSNATGGRVVFPRGTYKTTAPIRAYSARYLELIGAGVDTVIDYEGTNPNYPIMLLTDLDWPVFRNFRVFAGAAAFAGFAIGNDGNSSELIPTRYVFDTVKAEGRDGNWNLKFGWLLAPYFGGIYPDTDIAWTDANSEQHIFFACAVERAYIASWLIGHSQAKQIRFYSCTFGTSLSQKFGVAAPYGSFIWFGGGGGQNRLEEFAWSSGYVIDNLRHGAFCRSSGSIYENQTGLGTCGTVAPSHKSGIVSDGLINWKYITDAAATEDYLPYDAADFWIREPHEICSIIGADFENSSHFLVRTDHGNTPIVLDSIRFAGNLVWTTDPYFVKDTATSALTIRNSSIGGPEATSVTAMTLKTNGSLEYIMNDHMQPSSADQETILQHFAYGNQALQFEPVVVAYGNTWRGVDDSAASYTNIPQGTGIVYPLHSPVSITQNTASTTIHTFRNYISQGQHTINIRDNFTTIVPGNNIILRDGKPWAAPYGSSITFACNYVKKKWVEVSRTEGAYPADIQSLMTAVGEVGDGKVIGAIVDSRYNMAYDASNIYGIIDARGLGFANSFTAGTSGSVYPRRDQTGRPWFSGSYVESSDINYFPTTSGSIAFSVGLDFGTGSLAVNGFPEGVVSVGSHPSQGIRHLSLKLESSGTLTAYMNNPLVSASLPLNVTSLKTVHVVRAQSGSVANILFRTSGSLTTSSSFATCSFSWTGTNPKMVIGNDINKSDKTYNLRIAYVIYWKTAPTNVQLDAVSGWAKTNHGAN